MEFVLQVLGSIGGATAILYVLSKFLGNVWADRIAKQTMHRFSVELEGLRRESEITLEQTKALNQLSALERQVFSEISQKTYQEFFEKRLSTYKRLLAIRHEYIKSMADFTVDEFETWGDEFVRFYGSVRRVYGEDQLYLSAKLDETFVALRDAFDELVKVRDRNIAYLSQGTPSPEEESALNNEIYGKAHEFYKEFELQLDEDVRSLRSRIELDRV